jgi:glycosyltransferase involved in cell wall biosynthesis
MIQEDLKNFDVIHYHIDYLHFPLSKLSAVPHLTTLHGRLDIPDLKNVYDVFSDMPVVSISMSQRKPFPQINWKGNVYHGIPKDLYKPAFSNGKYLAFLGRISAEKGLDKAIEIAIQCGIPIKIAAKIDKHDLDYFNSHIKHRLDHPLVEFIGEIGENDKHEFLKDAIALLFPIEWPEPFGLVMIEAMACGTPVVAFRFGSVPEIIDNGRNGFVVNSVGEAVKAVQDISKIDRRNCRKVFEERFTSGMMAKEYAKVYFDISDRSQTEARDSKLMQSKSLNYELH